MEAWLTGQGFTFDATLTAPTFGDGGEATKCQNIRPADPGVLQPTHSSEPHSR